MLAASAKTERVFFNHANTGRPRWRYNINTIAGADNNCPSAIATANVRKVPSINYQANAILTNTKKAVGPIDA